MLIDRSTSGGKRALKPFKSKPSDFRCHTCDASPQAFDRSISATSAPQHTASLPRRPLGSQHHPFRLMTGAVLEKPSPPTPTLPAETPRSSRSEPSTTRDADGAVGWFFDQHGNNEESSAPECVDATGGFPFPFLLSRSPTYRAFLIGSLPRTARSLTVTLDNGQTLPSTLHDTGIGNHPIFSFVNLGTPTSETITGTITVTRRNRQDHQAPTLQVRVGGVARYDGGNRERAG